MELVEGKPLREVCGSQCQFLKCWPSVLQIAEAWLPPMPAA